MVKWAAWGNQAWTCGEPHEYRNCPEQSERLSGLVKRRGLPDTIEQWIESRLFELRKPFPFLVEHRRAKCQSATVDSCLSGPKIAERFRRLDSGGETIE